MQKAHFSQGNALKSAEKKKLCALTEKKKAQSKFDEAYVSEKTTTTKNT